MRHIALKVLIGSVVVSALLGIWALLVGNFGEFEIKVLLTSLCISGASLLAMACAAAWDKGPLPLLPRTGMGLSVAGFALLIGLIWAEAESAEAWKTAATLLIFATATAHASLVGLARLKSRHAWLMPATWLTAGLLALLVTSAIWGEWEDENVWRWVGVLSILLCAFTILVPVFGRMGRTDQLTAGEGVRFCPNCGKGLEAAYGTVACGACGERFWIEARSGYPDQTTSSSTSSSS